MNNRIEKIICVTTASTDAKDVDVAYRQFLIQNADAADPCYFKEKGEDGVAADSDNGWALAAGASTVFPLTAKTLSVVGSADIRVMILE